MQTAWTRDGLLISTDHNLIDLDRAHALVCATYWAKGIPRDTLRRAIESSMCFGLYRTAPDGGRTMIGLARVITDRATFAYLCDVVLDEAERGKGLGSWLMRVILAHPSLQGLRRFALLTRDAQPFYESLGFRCRPEMATRYMDRHNPNIYTAQADA